MCKLHIAGLQLWGMSVFSGHQNRRDEPPGVQSHAEYFNRALWRFWGGNGCRSICRRQDSRAEVGAIKIKGDHGRAGTVARIPLEAYTLQGDPGSLRTDIQSQSATCPMALMTSMTESTNFSQTSSDSASTMTRILQIFFFQLFNQVNRK